MALRAESSQEILVWDLAAGDPAAGELRIASDHRLGVFSADSRRYVLQTSAKGEPVTSWDLGVRPRRPQRTVIGRAAGADALLAPLAEWPETPEGRAMSRDARWFVEASYQTLRLWRFEDVEPRAALAQVDRYRARGDPWRRAGSIGRLRVRRQVPAGEVHLRKNRPEPDLGRMAVLLAG